MTESLEFKINKYYNNSLLYSELCNENSYTRKMYLEETKWKIKYLSKLLKNFDNINSVLDIGCATGDMLNLLPFGKEKLGIDICKKNIVFAREKYPHCKFICKDFYKLNYNECYDVIVLSEVLEHMINDLEVLKYAINNAKIILINVPLENELKIIPQYGLLKHKDGHLRGYTKNSIIDLIQQAGGKIIKEKKKNLNKSLIFYKQCLRKMSKSKTFKEKKNIIRFMNKNSIAKSYFIKVKKK